MQFFFKNSTLIKSVINAYQSKRFCNTNFIKKAKMRYISQEEAYEIDQKLLKEFNFSLDQLMEMAGLGCALSIADYYKIENYSDILILCGPGNNGGDGLVCARYLQLFGYNPHVFYPNLNVTNQRLDKLLYQIKKSDIPLFDATKFEPERFDKFHLVIDAVFGFSFKAPIRPSFKMFFEFLNNTVIPIVSIDMPSGWDINRGNVNNGFVPQMLISLTAPKKGCEQYKGIHYLSGRFIPNRLAKFYHLDTSVYKQSELFVRLNTSEDMNNSEVSNVNNK